MDLMMINENKIKLVTSVGVFSLHYIGNHIAGTCQPQFCDHLVLFFLHSGNDWSWVLI